MIISEGINHGKLQTIIVGELKKAGLKHRLKKIILKNVKDNKTVFGAPLIKVPSCSVICCGSTLSVPVVVSEMSAVLRANANIEGLFRKAGSQSRQKDIKRLLDAGGCVSEGHHPIDVASVLKLYLRSLPEPLISAEVQDLLLRCRLAAGEDALRAILHTLLLLPVLHVHLLHYIMELLNFIASRHKDNLMDSMNLAIVLAPSVMPLPAAASAQRLEHHVALVKMFIENAKHIGILTEELMSQLDDDSGVHIARRKKRRSGSLNRVLNGLRKMVSGSAHTPVATREHKTPVLSKSAAKRKMDAYEGLSAKKKKEIKQSLAQKELSFTPLKMSVTDRKRLRLSLLDGRCTPVVSSDIGSHKNSETSISSEDMLTSSEHLFTPHDTIDLSPDMKPNKDYVRISKQEYEEIKSRVSAIENRLSREFTDIIPRVEPLQQVQNVYEQTLEESAMLDCPTSDQLARRLSKELKIRPTKEPKIMRSPSARKIGSIRRRSKENVVKVVRHKSWNMSSQSSHNADRFYPYMGLRRERTSTATSSDLMVPKISTTSNQYDDSLSDNCMNKSESSQKYHLRKRSSIASPAEYTSSKIIGRPQKRRSLNVTINSLDITASDNSKNNTLNSSNKSNNSETYQNIFANKNKRFAKESPSKTQQKWKSAAAFFMDKTGEVDSSCQSGRPSVNKLRSQNAGAVLAKAKLFESSSDRSSEKHEVIRAGFARKPRVSGPYSVTSHLLTLPPRTNRGAVGTLAPTLPARSRNVTQANVDSWRSTRKTTPPIRKVTSPQGNFRTPQSVTIKKSLCTPRGLRTAGVNNNDIRRINTPMKAVHVSPRRRSPRQKIQRSS